jgi:hypothetical protein
VDFLESRLRALGGDTRQIAFAWGKERSVWQRAFPEYAPHLEIVPPLIDREYLWTSSAKAIIPIKLRFLNVMLWGYGELGYGPFRTYKMLQSPNLEASLEDAKGLVLCGQVIEAYKTLRKAKIEQLGPSYSTKVMCFLAEDANTAPPIFDSVVARNLVEHYPKTFDLQNSNSQMWSISNYSRYLDFVNEKRIALGLSSQEIEFLLYV